MRSARSADATSLPRHLSNARNYAQPALSPVMVFRTLELAKAIMLFHVRKESGRATSRSSDVCGNPAMTDL